MINLLEILKKGFMISFFLILLGCSSGSYNIYEVTYEVLYPTKTVTKTCIIKGEITTGCTTTGFFKDGPLIYFIDGEHEINKTYDSYPINIKNKKRIKTITY